MSLPCSNPNCVACRIPLVRMEPARAPVSIVKILAVLIGLAFAVGLAMGGCGSVDALGVEAPDGAAGAPVAGAGGPGGTAGPAGAGGAPGAAGSAGGAAGAGAPGGAAGGGGHASGGTTGQGGAGNVFGQGGAMGSGNASGSGNTTGGGNVGGTPCSKPNQYDCGGGCVDVSANAANCGKCGVECGPGKSCSAGVCS